MPRGRAREDLAGQVFGQLAVLAESTVDAGGRVVWRCRCACGTEKYIRSTDLKRKHGNKSCGCTRGQERGAQLRTHGESYKGATPEYKIWCLIRERCNNANNPAFKYYGGRGITVCLRWQERYDAFLEDMGRRPSAKHSIERKNNNGNYEPGNCVWATRLEQAANKRNNHYIEVNGETVHLSELARQHGLKQPTLRMRLKMGWTLERALSTPV